LEAQLHRRRTKVLFVLLRDAKLLTTAQPCEQP
jgi:hypothetical protein